MLGVKSSNDPITGVFAEQFCRHLLQSSQERVRVETDYEVLSE